EDGSQVSQLADAFSAGVRLRGSPPATGTVKISPPLAPSSLIRPPINAMLWPSGDQRGTAICVAGLRISRTSPVAADTSYRRATYQCQSPGGVEATAARCLPSGDQSYSWTCRRAGDVVSTRPESASRIVSRCAGACRPTSPSSSAAGCVGPVG